MERVAWQYLFGKAWGLVLILVDDVDHGALMRVTDRSRLADVHPLMKSDRLEVSPL